MSLRVWSESFAKEETVATGIALDLVDEVAGLVRGGQVGLGRGTSEDRVGPDLDEAVEGVVGDEVLGVEDLHGGGTRVVAAVEPALDAGPVVGHPRAQAHRGFHHVQRNRAPEESRHRDAQVVPPHLRERK
ncbi:hypothetical protein RJ639_013206 [Escallonia herrerae]|uniref:Uncharacterized protein n=1 Tax=Escallonia herrerae TaxID=1293975 RepID=A0AA88VIN2_9ASTE|nr:hypothetical protein RJ639_013206 [Escallonia herrerae]